MAARGSYARGVAKQEEILAAALEVFERNGYDRTSVREIARVAGISQAGLLHHFSSKEELFLEILRRRDEQSLATNAERRTHSVPGLIDAVERNSGQEGPVSLYVAMSAESALREGEVRDFFESRYGWVLADIARDVARMQTEGTLTKGLSAVSIASLLVAAADGLQTQLLLDPDGVDMVARMRDLLDILATPDDNH